MESSVVNYATYSIAQHNKQVIYGTGRDMELKKSKTIVNYTKFEGIHKKTRNDLKWNLERSEKDLRSN